MGECKTCFGNGFIVFWTISEPCPACWGTERDESGDTDTDDGNGLDDADGADSSCPF